MFRLLPMINHLFPGALTPFNVLEVSIEWWLAYAEPAQRQEAENKKQNREVRQRGK